MCGRRYIFKGATIRFTESRSSVLAVGRRSKKKSHKVRQKKKKPECPSEETSAPNRRCTCQLWKSTPFYTPSIMMCFPVCGVTTARSAKKNPTGLKTLKMLKKREKKGKNGCDPDRRAFQRLVEEVGDVKTPPQFTNSSFLLRA